VLVDACDVDGVYEVEESDRDDDTLVLHKENDTVKQKHDIAVSFIRAIVGETARRISVLYLGRQSRRIFSASCGGRALENVRRGDCIWVHDLCCELQEVF
ncbi:hypothetical protein Tco_1421360, partial [Tanacetum coccineum]